jgi:5-methylcytosine-specific restriction endonuclease McrA
MRRQAKGKAHGRKRAAWRRLRLEVLQRDRYRCRACGQGWQHGQLTVHLDPRLRGDHSRARPRDCITLCISCHGTVDAPDRACGLLRGVSTFGRPTSAP